MLRGVTGRFRDRKRDKTTDWALGPFISQTLRVFSWYLARVSAEMEVEHQYWMVIQLVWMMIIKPSPFCFSAYLLIQEKKSSSGLLNSCMRGNM